MEDDNEDNLKNKEDLHIAGRHTALDIFRFAVFLFMNPSFFKFSMMKFTKLYRKSLILQTTIDGK